jgi:RimJ/RimL family protein N-acetyltransferase
MVEVLYTDRLRLRDWSATDAQAALKIYGHDDVSRWLHTVERIPDEATMHRVLQRWDAERSDMTPGTGRWAVTLRDSGTLVGGISLLPMPVPEADVEIGGNIGAAVISPRPRGRWRAGPSSIRWSSYSHWSIRRTHGRRPPRDGSGWSGSARAVSTTGHICRYSGCDPTTSPARVRSRPG